MIYEFFDLISQLAAYNKILMTSTSKLITLDDLFTIWEPKSFYEKFPTD